MEHLNTGANKNSTMICCECGGSVPSNATNMCVGCLRNVHDIGEHIPKQGNLYFCRNCERYLNPPTQWVKAGLETKELMSLCLKKIKGIDKGVRLVDAGFVWTEPHSKRIKVKVAIQKEVERGAVLQQTFVVEFMIHNQMCDDCHRVEAKDYWNACVQVRQRTNSKKTLFYLEQLILKHRAHMETNTSNIKQVHEGLDFYYQHKRDAKKMVEFLQAVVPCRITNAEELISHDIRSNIYNYKFTFFCEIVPLCKDNIVCLPLKLARQLGNIGQICIINRVTQVVQLIEPKTKKLSEIRAEVFWQNPFSSICQSKQFVEYTVMDMEIVGADNVYKLHPVAAHDANVARHQGAESTKHALADVWVVKSSEVGISDPIHCRTHLGHLLRTGDTVLGFDLRNSNANDQNLDEMKPEHVPDVVLVKKFYGDKKKRARLRKWKLQHLEVENNGDNASIDRDFNEFLEDLEENDDIRKNINIYRDSNAGIGTDTESVQGDLPFIELSEMLEEIHISRDATGAAGDSMLE